MLHFLTLILILPSLFKYYGQLKSNLCSFSFFIKELKEQFHVYPCIAQLVKADMGFDW